ncbi:MAG TPA: hypothetical protein VJA66_15595 [Thermoanaerobaculia bacterium]
MRRAVGRLPGLVFAGILLTSIGAKAQSTPGFGRVSLFGYWSRYESGDPLGSSFTTGDVVASVTLRSDVPERNGFEYAVDMRGSSTSVTGADQIQRFYLYDAYVGTRTYGGVVGLRLGQMWLNDLGGLGSLGGGLLEIHPAVESKLGHPRIGLFGGLEPENFEAGYVSGVRKYGGYVALDGEGARRHVLGYVTIRNGSLTERSVITMTNFIPVGQKFFLYQALEYDLVGPAGLDEGKGLNYFFATARYQPIPLIEFQGTYHHGRSIDTRTITDDERNGRPVDTRTLQGFLFEAASGRITLQPVRGLRIYGGYERDRNNENDVPSKRLFGGLYYSNLFKSGFDLSVAGFHTDSPNGATGTYNSFYASLGKSLGSTVYLTAEYASFLSILQLTPVGGVQVENLPRSRRYSLSGLIRLTRSLSLLVSGERTWQDPSVETRATAGLTYRF